MSDGSAPSKAGFRMRLPATSANLGSGFDAVAVALDFYLEMEAEPAAEFSIAAPAARNRGCGAPILEKAHRKRRSRPSDGAADRRRHRRGPELLWARPHKSGSFRGSSDSISHASQAGGGSMGSTIPAQGRRCSVERHLLSGGAVRYSKGGSSRSPAVGRASGRGANRRLRPGPRTPAGPFRPGGPSSGERISDRGVAPWRIHRTGRSRFRVP